MLTWGVRHGWGCKFMEFLLDLVPDGQFDRVLNRIFKVYSQFMRQLSGIVKRGRERKQANFLEIFA